MDRQTQNSLLKIVRDNYTQIAGFFSETRKKEIWPELKKLADINDGARILDVGCGSGKILDVLADKDVRYLGIDLCPELLPYAQERYQGGERLKPENIEFAEGDILDLGKFKELDFDVVFCIAVLQHLPGKDLQEKALRQLKNKISDQGRLIFSVWNMWENRKTRALIWRFFLLKLIKKNKMDFGDVIFDWKSPEGQKVSKRYYHAFTKRELKRLFKKAGLKIDRLYYDKYNYYAVLSK